MDLATHLWELGTSMNRSLAAQHRDPWALTVGETTIGVYDGIAEAREIASLLIENSSAVWHLALSVEQSGPFVWRSSDGAVMRLERRRV